MSSVLTPITINGANGFDDAVSAAEGAPPHGLSLQTVQVNIGLKCNMACHHCHVESSPKRDEMMTWETMTQVLDAARRCGAQTVDITGGAPEMHPNFRRFVRAARAQGLGIMVRSNLTILNEPGFEDIPALFRELRVHVVASLPCYLEDNVDQQRGKHAYSGSVAGLQKLNAVGYGRDDALQLDLVFNPLGPSLPPAQAALESDYRRELRERFDIDFTRLITITNMPIGRFLHDLARDGRDEDYRQLLRNAFNPQTLEGLMCRHQIHVGWDGAVYDCDFNFALGLTVNDRAMSQIADFDPDVFLARRIATGEHCFGCTAGAGSSCGGALV